MEDAAPEAFKLTVAYSIHDDKFVASIGDTPFDLTLYKLGNAYWAARSTEFGYVNYEIMAKPPVNLVSLAKGESKQRGAAN